MNERIEKIHYDWLTCPTGDPFADAGGYALNEFSKRFPNDDILQLIERVTDIYVDRWNAGLHMFFLNSTITQGQFDSQQKKEETRKYYKSLINEESDSVKGFCRILGKYTVLFKAGRDNSILTGSSTFLNFHHNFEEGLYCSKEVIIRFFFAPLACCLVSNQMALIISNKKNVSDLFFEENVRKALSNTNFRFAPRSKYSNPANALFAFVNDSLAALDDEDDEGCSLSLYHFSNFAAKPNIDIYNLPSRVFSFYSFCMNRKYRWQWECFVKAQYVKFYQYDSKYNVENQHYEEHTKEVYLLEKRLYDKLMSDQSLQLSLNQFGVKKNKKEQDCYIVEKAEFDNVKKNPAFKLWEESANNKSLLKNGVIKETGDYFLEYSFENVRYKWKNLVYERLLLGVPIIQLILKWTDPSGFGQPLDYRIVKQYQIIIRNMNTKTLELIEKLSDYIIDNNDNISATISKIKVGNRGELRSFIIKQIEHNYKDENNTPLVTLREFVEYLFPEGTGWTEIRDLFLICIYQKLHEKNIKVDIAEQELLELNEENNN